MPVILKLPCLFLALEIPKKPRSQSKSVCATHYKSITNNLCAKVSEIFHDVTHLQQQLQRIS